MKANTIKKSDNALKKKDVYTIVLERMEDSIKMIAEGVSFMSKKIDRRSDELDKKIDDFASETRYHFKELFAFKTDSEKNFKVIREYLSKIDDRLGEIEVELKEAKVTPEKIDSNRVQELEKEVEYLKKEINRQGKLIQLKLCA